MYQKKCYFFISENLQFCVKGQQPLASLSSINQFQHRRPQRKRQRELLLPSCFRGHGAKEVRSNLTRRGVTRSGWSVHRHIDGTWGWRGDAGVKLRGFAVRRQQRFHRHKRGAANPGFFSDWNQEVFNCKRPLTSQEKASAGDKPTIGQDVLQLKVWGCTLKRAHPLRCKGHTTSQSRRDRFQRTYSFKWHTLLYIHAQTHTICCQTRQLSKWRTDLSTMTEHQYHDLSFITSHSF